MKKIIIVVSLAILFFSISAALSNAQMMDGSSNSAANRDEVVEHTLREEKEGKELWEKLKVKEINCADLGDEQFGVLGEYFMGAMMGDSHAAMNDMIIQTHGEDVEEQIHIAMGKRISGCDTSASMPDTEGGWSPMMNMLAPYGTEGSRTRMMGRWSSPSGFNQINNPMMWGNNPIGWSFGLGWIFMIFWWILIIVGAVALVRWLTNELKGGSRGKSALDILKERYAKGEINKQEFEEKKKDLT